MAVSPACYVAGELKELYARFVAVVEAGSHDSLVHVKQKTIGTLYALLSSLPELERRYRRRRRPTRDGAHCLAAS